MNRIVHCLAGVNSGTMPARGGRLETVGASPERTIKPLQMGSHAIYVLRVATTNSIGNCCLTDIRAFLGIRHIVLLGGPVQNWRVQVCCRAFVTPLVEFCVSFV